MTSESSLGVVRLIIVTAIVLAIFLGLLFMSKNEVQGESIWDYVKNLVVNFNEIKLDSMSYGSVREKRIVENEGIPLTSTEVSCMIAKEVLRDYTTYGLSESHDGEILKPFTEYTEILTCGSSSNPCGIGKFKIKLRMKLEDAEAIKAITSEVTFDDSDVYVGSTGSFVQIDKFKFIGEAGKENAEDLMFEHFYDKFDYWKFEDLSLEDNRTIIDSCSNEIGSGVSYDEKIKEKEKLFLHCLTPFVDGDCVARILNGLKVGGDSGAKYFCTGKNTGADNSFRIGSEKLYFGYKSAYAANRGKFDARYVDSLTQCNSGYEGAFPVKDLDYRSFSKMIKDPFSAWGGKINDDIYFKKSIAYSSYYTDNNDGSMNFPPQLFDSNGTEVLNLNEYAWIIIWNRVNRQYSFEIFKVPRQAEIDGMTKLESFFLTIKWREDGTIKELKNSYFTRPEFRIKANVIFTPEADMSVYDLVNGLNSNTAPNMPLIFKDFNFEYCSDEESCMYPPGRSFNQKDTDYRPYTAISVMITNGAGQTIYNKEEKWNGYIEDGHKLNVRTPLDYEQKDALEAGSKYSIVLFYSKWGDERQFFDESRESAKGNEDVDKFVLDPTIKDLTKRFIITEKYFTFADYTLAIIPMWSD